MTREHVKTCRGAELGAHEQGTEQFLGVSMVAGFILVEALIPAAGCWLVWIEPVKSSVASSVMSSSTAMGRLSA